MLSETEHAELLLADPVGRRGGQRRDRKQKTHAKEQSPMPDAINNALATGSGALSQPEPETAPRPPTPPHQSVLGEDDRKMCSPRVCDADTSRDDLTSPVHSLA